MDINGERNTGLVRLPDENRSCSLTGKWGLSYGWMMGAG